LPCNCTLLAYSRNSEKEPDRTVFFVIGRWDATGPVDIFED
jgi:hypothetical protein